MAEARRHRPARRGRAARAAEGRRQHAGRPTRQRAAAVQQLRGLGRRRARSARRPRRARKTYAHADAVRILDAWWPLLVEAEFKPGLGSDALRRADAPTCAVDEAPSAAATGRPARTPELVVPVRLVELCRQGHAGGARRAGRGPARPEVLRRRRASAPAVTPCCSTLKQAAGKPADQVYPGDESCAAGDQWCADSIIHRTLGGITHGKISWQNRPTYQQVVEFPLAPVSASFRRFPDDSVGNSGMPRAQPVQGNALHCARNRQGRVFCTPGSGRPECPQAIGGSTRGAAGHHDGPTPHTARGP